MSYTTLLFAKFPNKGIVYNSDGDSPSVVKVTSGTTQQYFNNYLNNVTMYTINKTFTILLQTKNNKAKGLKSQMPSIIIQN